MDVATIIGLVAGFAMIALAIVGHGEPLGTFRDWSSVLIVFGGTFAALLISMPLTRVLSAARIAKKALFEKKTEPEKVIRDLVRYAEIARREGILALEGRTREIDDDFIVHGIQLTVDGTDPETTEQILMSELAASGERHKMGRKVFETLAKYSPAFGMVGTLIGLIIMLNHMDDSGKLGSGMAIALVTTFYGLIAANLIFGPIADKLGARSQEELLVKEIVIRGILAIQAGDNPRIVEQKLRTFLPERFKSARVDRHIKAA